MENITSPSFQLPLQASITYPGDPGVLVTATAHIYRLQGVFHISYFIFILYIYIPLQIFCFTLVETQALWRAMSLSSFLPSFLVSLARPASNLAFSIGYSVRLPVIVISLNVIGYKPILYFDF